MQAAARYTKDLDVYLYELLLVPLRVGPHWTSVVVDMATQQIRYLDSTQEGGSEHILKIRRWLRHAWEPFHTEQALDRTTLPSTFGTTPRQPNDSNCGVYQLMFMLLLANGKPLDLLADGSMEASRQFIATTLWTGELINSQADRITRVHLTPQE